MSRWSIMKGGAKDLPSRSWWLSGPGVWLFLTRDHRSPKTQVSVRIGKLYVSRKLKLPF